VAGDSQNNLFFTGNLSYGVNFGGGVISSQSFATGFLVKYAPPAIP